MSAKKKPTFIKYAVIVGVIIAAYFIYVEVQTRLGEKALAATGLELRSLDEAMVVAKKQNKLVLADLSAIWCPTCRKLDKFVFTDAAVQSAIREKYVFTRIEYESDEGEAFMEMYDVHAFPTLLALDANGTLIKKLPITTDPVILAKNL